MSEQTVRKEKGSVVNTTAEESAVNAETRSGLSSTSGGRPRSMTTLKLQWLAERARKCQKIKAQISSGEYAVDSRKVAQALLDIEE